MKNLNSLMDQILYQIFKIILNIYLTSETMKILENKLTKTKNGDISPL